MKGQGLQGPGEPGGGGQGRPAAAWGSQSDSGEDGGAGRFCQPEKGKLADFLMCWCNLKGDLLVFGRVWGMNS